MFYLSLFALTLLSAIPATRGNVTTLYAGTSAGLFRSDDGGEQWSRVRNAVSGSVHSVCIAGSKIYVGTNESRLMVSTDHGRTWNVKLHVAPGSRRDLELRSTIEDIFVVGEKVYVATTRDGLFVSDDGGETWATKTLEDLGANHTFSIFVVGNVIYLGTNMGLATSTNGGRTWTTRLILDVAPGIVHDESILSVLANGEEVYAAVSNVGLAMSKDGGRTWVRKTRRHGLSSATVTTVFVVGPRIYVGTTQGLSVSSDDGRTWVTKNGRDGMRNAMVTAVFTMGRDVWVGTGDGVSMSRDGGETWSNTRGMGPKVTVWTVVGESGLRSSNENDG